MNRRKLILLCSALFSTLIVAITATFAWYINAGQTDNMRFSITQINSNVVLYEAYDTNYNGIPDKCTTSTKNKYYNGELKQNVAYQLRYYDESYYFKYLDQRYALSDDSTSNLLNTIEITDIVPSKVYTYKYELINYSGVENGLKFGFEADDTVALSTLKDFQVRLAIVETTGTKKFTDWTDFTDGTSYSGIELNPLSTSMTIPAKTSTFDLGRIDVWLQIRIKAEATTSLTKFKLPQHRITLSLDI